METRLTVQELAKALSNVLERVREGESFRIERNGETLAYLVPGRVAPGVTLREAIAKVGDLKMPGEGFADDLEAIQLSQPKASVAQWPS